MSSLVDKLKIAVERIDDLGPTEEQTAAVVDAVRATLEASSSP